MKKILLLALFIPFGASAQSDESLIQKTLDNYLDGGTNGDVERFKSAFLPDAIQKSIGKNGEVIGMSVASLSSKIKPGTVMTRTTKVISWSYAGVAGTAITETAYENSKIIDLLNLLKVNGEWKIISRVYSRIESNEDVTSSSGSTSAPETASKSSKPAPAAKKKPVIDDGW